MLISANPWENETKAGLVRLPPPYSHSLHISTSGPPRRSPKQPVVMVFTGGGVPCAPHVRLQRLLSERYRVYFYDRAGYDWSEVPGELGGEVREGEAGDEGDSCMMESTLARRALGWENGSRVRQGERKRKRIYAEDSAKEARALMLEIGIRGPYVLIAHSYGGIIASEFMALVNGNSSSSHSWDGDSELGRVIGLALMETGSPLLYHTYQPSIPPPEFDSMLEGVDIPGLSHLKEESGLTDEEWEEGLRAIDRTEPAAKLEENRGSARILARKKQGERCVMDPWPVAVLKADNYGDWKMMYDAGVKRGNGTEAERKECERFLEDMEFFDEEVKSGQLRLTGEGEERRRWRVWDECGHDVIIREPEVVVEEVKWVMGVLEGLGWR